MGLFTPNYTREGPGVEKNAPQKKRFFLFFEIYFRKFWKICQLNLLYILFFLPAAVGAYHFLSGGNAVLSALLALITLVLYGPATAGLSYVLRNFAREEHAFIWSDFKDNLKSNFKQSAIYGTCFLIITVMMSISAYFYYLNSASNKILLAPMILCLACLLILCFMDFYMYTMIVTFRLTLRQMLKNAFIFSIVGVFSNLLTFLITGVITVLCVLFFPISLILVIPIVPATTRFIIAFNTYPKIQKYMIDPYNAEHGGDAPAEDEEERVFSDERIIPPADDDNAAG